MDQRTCSACARSDSEARDAASSASREAEEAPLLAAAAAAAAERSGSGPGLPRRRLLPAAAVAARRRPLGAVPARCRSGGKGAPLLLQLLAVPMLKREESQSQLEPQQNKGAAEAERRAARKVQRAGAYHVPTFPSSTCSSGTAAPFFPPPIVHPHVSLFCCAGTSARGRRRSRRAGRSPWHRRPLTRLRNFRSCSQPWRPRRGQRRIPRRTRMLKGGQQRTARPARHLRSHTGPRVRRCRPPRRPGHTVCARHSRSRCRRPPLRSQGSRRKRWRPRAL